MGGLAAAAALALAWVATLRRRVSVRTAELRATEERYRLLADSASDLVVTVDPSLRVNTPLKRGPDGRAARCLDGIREAALRGSGLTRQILTFGRQSPSVLHALDPREVVAEAARMLRLLVPRGVTVEERLESTGFVAADATQLHQVVANLGTNAGLSMQATGRARAWASPSCTGSFATTAARSRSKARPERARPSASTCQPSPRRRAGRTLSRPSRTDGRGGGRGYFATGIRNSTSGATARSPLNTCVAGPAGW